MLVCFTSDLHGDRMLYGQLEDLLCAAQPDLLILGGDLLRDIDSTGPVIPQTARLEGEFLNRIATWRAAQPRLTVACIPGNHELLCTLDAFRRAHDAGRLVLLEGRRPWHFGGLAWLGYPCTPPSPHWAKDFERLDLPGDPLPTFDGVAWDSAGQRLQPIDRADYFGRRPTAAAELAEIAIPSEPWVLVAHAPPHASHLDRLPQVPYPIGSRAVRQFIETRQPFLALHGHVHESPEITGHFTDQLGATLCINPGQGRGRLQAVLFELEQPAQTIRHTVFH